MLWMWDIFTRKCNLHFHQVFHTRKEPYICSDCDKCFADKWWLRTHQRIHTGEQPYKCSECEKLFTHKGSLKAHQRIYTGEKSYKCSKCGKCFSQQYNLKIQQRIHTGCSECDECFSQKVSLIKHCKIHTCNNSFKCHAGHICFLQCQTDRLYTVKKHKGMRKCLPINISLKFIREYLQERKLLNILKVWILFFAS